LDVGLFVLFGVVLPIVVNKTTEGYLNWIKPHLRWVWTGIFAFLTCYGLSRPIAWEFTVNLHKNWHGSPILGYALWASFGILLFSFYWWLAGKSFYSGGPPSPVVASSRPQPPTASEIAEELAKRISPSPTSPHTGGPSRSKTPVAKTEPEPVVLIFANSPLLTDARKEEIRRDISGFRDYLISLRVNAPLVVPPISVGSLGTFTKPLELTGPAGAEDRAMFLWSGGRYEYRSYPNQKQSTDFSHNIVLLAPELSDRTAITSLYGMYALGQFLDRTEPDPDDFYWQARDMAITNGAVYFSSSFWNARVRYPLPYEALWEIREKLGQKFVDQLIAYTMRAFNESIYRSHKSDLGAYFYARLKDADDIIDNDGSAMRTITEVWTKYKLPVSGPFVPNR
jgi:hypothetical protein